MIEQMEKIAGDSRIGSIVHSNSGWISIVFSELRVRTIVLDVIAIKGETKGRD